MPMVVEASALMMANFEVGIVVWLLYNLKSILIFAIVIGRKELMLCAFV